MKVVKELEGRDRAKALGMMCSKNSPAASVVGRMSKWNQTVDGRLEGNL